MGIRTFVALPLGEGLRARLAEVQQALERQGAFPGYRWLPAGSIHLTLRFLGDTDESRLPAIEEALRRAASGRAAFRMALVQVGCFPNPVRPRVVWLGPAAGDAGVWALMELQGAVERELAPLGFPPEERPFRAHLTVGRPRGEARRLDRIRVEGAFREAERLLAPSPPLLEADRLMFIQSELSRAGARYTPLAAVPLGDVAGG
ncbi:MAG: RNA 2',3'-cyclic phosphodiesterase [Nitrospinota bacterium]